MVCAIGSNDAWNLRMPVWIAAVRVSRGELSAGSEADFGGYWVQYRRGFGGWAFAEFGYGAFEGIRADGPWLLFVDTCGDIAVRCTLDTEA